MLLRTKPYKQWVRVLPLCYTFCKPIHNILIGISVTRWAEQLSRDNKILSSFKPAPSQQWVWAANNTCASKTNLKSCPWSSFLLAQQTGKNAFTYHRKFYSLCVSAALTHLSSHSVLGILNSRSIFSAIATIFLGQYLKNSNVPWVFFIFMSNNFGKLVTEFLSGFGIKYGFPPWILK